MAPAKKIMYALRLDPEQKALLEAVKARDGISESEQIRRALVIWFAKKGLRRVPRKK